MSDPESYSHAVHLAIKELVQARQAEARLLGLSDGLDNHALYELTTTHDCYMKSMTDMWLQASPAMKHQLNAEYASYTDFLLENAKEVREKVRAMGIALAARAGASRKTAEMGNEMLQESEVAPRVQNMNRVENTNRVQRPALAEQLPEESKGQGHSAQGGGVLPQKGVSRLEGEERFLLTDGEAERRRKATREENNRLLAKLKELQKRMQ